MDIKEFIKQTIVDISNAIWEINTGKIGTGLVISPESTYKIGQPNE